MILFGKDLDHEVAIIAEVGVNHEGDVEAASRLLRLASEAGADAVKLQTYTPARFASASDPERLERVSKFGLDADAHRRLAREAEELGTPLFSSAITEDVVPLLAELCPAIKIASGDVDFEAVIRAAAQTGKPVVLSTGIATVEEIDRAIGWVRDEVGEDQLRDRLIVTHCVSAYPTPLEEANVLSVPFLAEHTGLRIGYSNHVSEPEACYAAVALGACVLEVHFTDQKTGRTFRDHALSMEPDELRHLIATVPRIRASLGSYSKERMPSELGNLLAVRKGVVAARDLAADTVLTADDLMYARPGDQFPASALPKLIGRRLRQPLTTGVTVPRDAVE